MRRREEPATSLEGHTAGRHGCAAKAQLHGQETSFAGVSSQHSLSFRGPWAVAELEVHD